MSSSIAFRRSFLRLPPATAALVLAAIFGATNGHAILPRETKTAAYHELNVVAWPPLPTEAPISPFELLRREDDNTICGYIGGNTGLPATCSAGSHCVLDSDSGFVGCCPNGGACTTGVFTSCVDHNNGALTESNPYVYTCQGSDVCYKNEYAGGYFQYGCGSASNLATTVQTSLEGSSLELLVTSVPLTASATSLATPTSIIPSTGTNSKSQSSSVTSSKSSFSTKSTSTQSSSSRSSSRTSSSTTTSSSSTTSTSSSTSITSSTSTSSTSSASSTAAPATGAGFDRTGAIVGGTISGVAILAAFVALLIFFLRKRRNQRQGPGPTPAAAPSSEYMSPMRSHGAAFAPLPTWQEEDEPVTPQPPYNQPYNPNAQVGNQQYNQAYNETYSQVRNQHLSQAYNEPNYGAYDPGTGTTTHISAGPEVAPPLRYNPVHVEGRGSTPIADAHMSPTSREIDDFSHAYGAAISHNGGDEDRQPLTVVNPDLPGGPGSASGSDSGSPSRNGSRPLWQQNRRQSRNLMWM